MEERTKENVTRPLFLVCGHHERGRGEKQRLLTLGTQLLGFHPLLLFLLLALPELPLWCLAPRIFLTSLGKITLYNNPRA